MVSINDSGGPNILLPASVLSWDFNSLQNLSYDFISR